MTLWAMLHVSCIHQSCQVASSIVGWFIQPLISWLNATI